MAIEITFETNGLEEALRQAPKEITFAVDKQLQRAALEVAREMKRGVAAEKLMAFSTLINSIKDDKNDVFDYRIGPHVNYARYVEEGRTAGGGMPPLNTIIDWVKVKGITPNNADMSQRDLAWMIAKSIQRYGTPARPFVAPLANDKTMQDRISELVSKGVAEGLSHVG